MKLELWSGQISKGKLDQFHTLNALTSEKKIVLDVETKEVILEHLRALQKEFLSYFEDVFRMTETSKLSEILSK